MSFIFANFNSFRRKKLYIATAPHDITAAARGVAALRDLLFAVAAPRGQLFSVAAPRALLYAVAAPLRLLVAAAAVACTCP